MKTYIQSYWVFGLVGGFLLVSCFILQTVAVVLYTRPLGERSHFYSRFQVKARINGSFGFFCGVILYFKYFSELEICKSFSSAVVMNIIGSMSLSQS